MTRYLLDANHISSLVTEHHPLRERVLEQILEGDEFYIPVLGLAEAMYGFLLIRRARQNGERWALIRGHFFMLATFEEDVVEATEMRVDMRKKGRQIALVDSIIAITAIRHDLILLTSDRDFEPIRHLETENWRRG